VVHPVRVKLHFNLTRGRLSLQVDQEISLGVIGLFGPPGSGKSTILRVLAGADMPDEGTITIGDRVLFDSACGINVAPSERRIGYVPQEEQHRRWAGVRELFRHSAASSEAESEEITKVFGCSGLLTKRLWQISKSDLRSLQVARAVVGRPTVLLCDEPLLGLDGYRRSILPHLRYVAEHLHIPVMYISHNTDELLALAEKVWIIDEGRITNAVDPRELQSFGMKQWRVKMFPEGA
jgi:molybdate transport system ATP-binding protein